MHIIKLSCEREVDHFHVGEKMLVRNHTKDIWDHKYDVAYHWVHMMA